MFLVCLGDSVGTRLFSWDIDRYSCIPRGYFHFIRLRIKYVMPSESWHCQYIYLKLFRYRSSSLTPMLLTLRPSFVGIISSNYRYSHQHWINSLYPLKLLGLWTITEHARYIVIKRKLFICQSNQGNYVEKIMARYLNRSRSNFSLLAPQIRTTALSSNIRIGSVIGIIC